MEETLRLWTLIEAGGKDIERNSTFTVIKTLNNVFETAVISIKKDYLEANEIEIAEEDEIKIKAGIKKDDFTVIFSGQVIGIEQSKTHIKFMCQNNLEMKEIISETLEEINISDALKKLADRDFRANDKELKKVVFGRSKAKEFDCLIETLKRATAENVFYYNGDDKIVVVNELSGETYDVTDNLYFAGVSELVVFYIPGITFADKIKYGEKEYNIRQLVFSEKNILCGITKTEG